MYVYKITDRKNNKVYIGIDTNSKDKLLRWKAHLRNSRYAIKSGKRTTNFYKNLGARPQDFYVEIIAESDSIYELLQLEIKMIDQYNSFHTGYNSTRGGECFKAIIKSDDHYKRLYEIFKVRMDEFNKIKWGGKTLDEKRAMMRTNTDESNRKKSETIKANWDSMDEDAKRQRLSGLLEYINLNKEKYRINAKIASDAAAAKTSISVTVRNKIDGKIYKFKSLKEVYRVLGVSGRHLMNLKRIGKGGTRKWEIIDDKKI